MSQHSFETTYKGRPISIVAGWDKPLQGFYLFIELLDATGDDDEEEEDYYLYSNLGDAELAAYYGLPPTFDYFVNKLTSFGLKIPDRMYDEIMKDQRQNVVNRRVGYNADGTFIGPIK